jgi:segregation and condensation protein A
MTDRVENGRGAPPQPDGGTDALTGEGDPSVSPADGEEKIEPVEVLVGMAEDGEIDPWDIDIVAVTDAFLARLDRPDLRTSGRALFYASVLLRMKSEALLSTDDDPEEEPPEPWEVELGIAEAPPEKGAVGPGPDAGTGPDPVDGLEAEMERRLDRKRARGTPETLDELVRELREAEVDSWWKNSREYDTSDSPSGYARGTQTLDYRPDDDFRTDAEPTEVDALGTAHTEDIESTIESVFDALGPHYDHGRDEVLFAEVETAGGSRVETYLGVLFLSHRGEVDLVQDEFFGDLWVRQSDTPPLSDR